MEQTLNSLPRSEALQIIRAFGFFSHLANIAEDQHHIRRSRAHAFTPSAPPRAGSMAHVLAQARAANVPPDRLRQFFAEAMVVPVLTAHPTEVRRKSMIDREMEVAELLAERDRYELTAEETAVNEAALRRAILTLWQTNLLRRTRLQVTDEVNNGLAYYDYTFLKELPRFYADLETELAGLGAISTPLPSFLRMGSWIGGDRDGNPFVNETVLRDALRLQSTKALRHYLAELRLLGAELSLDSRLVEVSPSLAELAARSPDRSAFRRYEPNAMRCRVIGGTERNGGAIDLKRSTVRRRVASKAPRQILAARADHAGNAQHFAFMQVEADIGEGPVLAKAIAFQQDFR